MKAAINQEIKGALVTAAPTTKASFFALPDRKVLIALALSGVAATIAFDVFGQFLSPAAGFVELAPVAIAPAGSNRSSHGGDEMAEASGKPSSLGSRRPTRYTARWSAAKGFVVQFLV